MKGEANLFLAPLRWIRATDELRAALGRDGPATAARLGGREFGTVVTDRRSSWVRRVQIDTLDCYVKTYDYPSLRDRIRGATRHTGPGRSRARREWDALAWQRAHGFAAPAPLLVAEARSAGLLRRAVLVTAAWPGEDLTAWLPRLAAAERAQLLATLATMVDRLHAAGFVDRNLDPRNLLARRTGDGGFEIAKIDSPRHRLVRPGGRRARRLATADRARLARGLAAFGAALPD